MSGQTTNNLRPVPEDAPVVGREESAVVVGVIGQPDAYKTEFVKIYQDAGVIGASMLTLLVLCFLLGVFSLRLLKMYVSLMESRDKLETIRSGFLERITERLLTLETKVGTVIVELRSDHTSQSACLDTLVAGQNRFDSRMDRMQDRESSRDVRETSRDKLSARNERDAREARSDTHPVEGSP